LRRVLELQNPIHVYYPDEDKKQFLSNLRINFQKTKDFQVNPLAVQQHHFAL